MGAQSFYIKAVATSASIAWEKELTENDSYYGDNYYSGHPTHSNMRRGLSRISSFIDSNKTIKENEKIIKQKFKKELHKYINDLCDSSLSNIDTGECKYICLGIDHYELVKTKKVAVKYKDKRIVYRITCNGTSKNYDDLKNAQNAAHNRALEYGQEAFIEKVTLYDRQESETLYKYEVTKEKRDKKPSKVKEGYKLVTFYKYVFVGWAGC